MTDLVGLFVSFVSLLVSLTVGSWSIRMQKRQDQLVTSQQTMIQVPANLVVAFAEEQKEGDRAVIRATKNTARLPLIVKNTGDQVAHDVIVEFRLDPEKFKTMKADAKVLGSLSQGCVVWQVFFEHPVYPGQTIQYQLDIGLRSPDGDTEAVITLYWTDSIPNVKSVAQLFLVRNAI
jgi:hypothetical protein